MLSAYCTSEQLFIIKKEIWHICWYIKENKGAIISLAPISFYLRGLWCDEYIINIYVMSFSWLIEIWSEWKSDHQDFSLSCLTFFQTSKLVFSSLYLKLYKTSASIGAWNENFPSAFRKFWPTDQPTTERWAHREVKLQLINT